MPRTKVSKSTKRFRETSNSEEKLREFEASFDGYLHALELKGKAQIKSIEDKFYVLLMGTDSNVLNLLMGDVLSLNLTKPEDCKKYLNTLAVNNSAGGAKQTSGKQLNPNDEGYLTEDSTNGGSTIGISTSTLSAYSRASIKQQQQRGRTPGPLSSARARRPRRSRSACDDLVQVSTLKSTSSSTVMDTRISRSKMRTPTATRSKAFSADRSSQICGQQFSMTMSASSPAAAFLRWPKPGEVVLSKCGSPVVAQVMPDKFANVNIPTKNGVFSLRPKKLEELKSDIIDAIDADTLNQIKTLHDNLNLIMKMADGSSTK
ncbi:PREDICTED: borealin-like isoform X1 [Bactrocera latifrons]|uniref:Borealin n=2 Tax=Bactrocera latifrons TaxID=174628 RepID=A0A0K8UEX1_BACLA|nr:PREDICTED: borealin-like isoform X1 [Bactrocera latifrons]